MKITKNFFEGALIEDVDADLCEEVASRRGSI